MDPKKVEFDLEAGQEKKVANDAVVPPPAIDRQLPCGAQSGRGCRGRATGTELEAPQQSLPRATILFAGCHVRLGDRTRGLVPFSERCLAYSIRLI